MVSTEKQTACVCVHVCVFDSLFVSLLNSVLNKWQLYFVFSTRVCSCSLSVDWPCRWLLTVDWRLTGGWLGVHETGWTWERNTRDKKELTRVWCLWLDYQDVMEGKRSTTQHTCDNSYSDIYMTPNEGFKVHLSSFVLFKCCCVLKSVIIISGLCGVCCWCVLYVPCAAWSVKYITNVINVSFNKIRVVL